MSFAVRFTPKAARQLDDCNTQSKERILKAVHRLAGNPFTAANVKAMTGGGYRLRVGDWRVLYDVDGEALLVLVLKLGHRREVYRMR